MKNLILSIAITLLVFTYTASNGQVPPVLGTPAPTATVAVKIIEVLDLAVTSGGTVTFDFNSIATLDAGITQANAVRLTYKSNKPWFININANSEFFTGGLVTNPTPMPASVIQYKLNGGAGDFIPLSTTAASLTGTTGAKNSRGTSTIGVDYMLNPGYIYAPATDYGMVITYTISNQ